MLDMQTTVTAAHRHLNDFIQRWLAEYQQAGKAIYCRDHCANCCRMAVHCTFPEAALVAAALGPQQSADLEVYIGRLTETAATLHDMPSYLKQHPSHIGYCPFVAGGSCSLYAIRPLSCRSLLATRPADWCGIDLSELDPWDIKLYQDSLEIQTVAWPTHYVAASQDFGRALEEDLLNRMQQQVGWSLSGNFPLLVWLEKHHRLSDRSDREVSMIITDLPFDSRHLLVLTSESVAHESHHHV